MIVVDISQVLISTVVMSSKGDPGNLNEDLFRHFVLNSLLSYRRKWSAEFGNEIILAADGHDYWRKDCFPQYKKPRKKLHADSKFDWSKIFTLIYKILGEIEENFPYKVANVYGAEADDVIAIIARDKDPREKMIILSGDKDLKQLQKYPNVYQYDPVRKSNIRVSAGELNNEMFKHIVRGDATDGIPNILSDDDTMVNESKRQRRLTAKKIDSWLNDPNRMIENYSGVFQEERLLRNFQRNKTLIDLNEIPENIAENIRQELAKPKKVEDRKKIQGYLIKHRISDHLSNIQYF